MHSYLSQIEVKEQSVSKKKSWWMTKSLQVWEKTPHNSTGRLMTNDTFSSLLAKDKGLDWKGKEPGHKMCTFNRPLGKTGVRLSVENNHEYKCIKLAVFSSSCLFVICMFVDVCMCPYMHLNSMFGTWLTCGIPESNSMLISRPLARFVRE